MKQSSTMNVVVWVWLAVYLLAAGILLAGGLVMFMIQLVT
jgi:hypothetical protein